jgi:hypothetical protein
MATFDLVTRKGGVKLQAESSFNSVTIKTVSSEIRERIVDAVARSTLTLGVTTEQELIGYEGFTRVQFTMHIKTRTMDARAVVNQLQRSL